MVLTELHEVVSILMVGLLLLGSLPAALGHAQIVAGVEEHGHDEDGQERGHLPSSTIGIQEVYTVIVPNEEQVDTIEVQVLLPPEFELVRTETPQGWTLTTSPGGERTTLLWNGSRIEPRGEAEFVLHLVNPTVVDVFSFVVVQVYEEGEPDVWRPIVMLVPPNEVFGIRVSAIGLGAVGLVLVLPIVESLLVNRREE